MLVNNAGIQRRGPLEDYPEETWRELMRANLDSVFYVGQAVARHMIPRKRGRIINIGSVQSELARTNIAPLHRLEGRGEDADQGHGDRLGQAWTADQRDRARLFRHRTQQGARRGREILRLAHGPHADGPAGATSRSWSAPRSSSPPTPRVSSMDTSSMSTAASPPASEGVAIVVMGVSGSGKTTLGVRLAQTLGAEFIDGDDLHTDAARAKMKAGHALTDEDRWPWLDRIGAKLAEGERTVVACSALAARLPRPSARRGRAKTALRLSGGDPRRNARPRRRSGRALHAGLAGRQPVRRAGAARRRGGRDRDIGGRGSGSGDTEAGGAHSSGVSRRSLAWGDLSSRFPPARREDANMFEKRVPFCRRSRSTIWPTL